MRILDVCPRPALPLYRGSAVRTGALLRRLSTNHEVRQFCQTGWKGLRGRPWIERRELGRQYTVYEYHHPAASAVRGITERNWVSAPVSSGWGLSLTRPKLLDELLDWAEVVLVEFPWQFDYCFRRRRTQHFVLASHNVETAKFADYARAQGLDPERNRWMELIERQERLAATNADLVLAVSPEDRVEFVQTYDLDPDRVINIPNGADVDRYRPASESERSAAKQELRFPDKPVVLFMGSDVPPNRVALRWLERTAARTDRFTFVALGPVSGEPRVSGNLIYAGQVVDLRPYLRAADFFLCSIEHGGGTKIKLLEALASGLPTVAFRKCLHGTDLRDSEHVLVAEPDISSLLESLERLAQDSELAARIGRNGRNQIVAQYNWDTIAGRLEEALLGLMSGKAAEAPTAACSPVT